MVTLLTSSPEPEVEEHYAEDSIDSTYQEEEEDLPGGSGWVKKALPGKGKAADRSRRGVSLSALPGRATGGGNKPSSSLNGGKAARVRRKTSVKF